MLLIFAVGAAVGGVIGIFIIGIPIGRARSDREWVGLSEGQ